MNKFNEDYFEHGQQKRLSGYTNYHWMPDRSFAEAAEIITKLAINPKQTVLDYGCAKGYLTYALRCLGVNAHGEDISEYALKHCHPLVTPYVSLPTRNKYDYIIAKDILEHVPEMELPALIKDFANRTNVVYAIIPLGDSDMFRIREYEIDVTHVTKKPEDWWIRIFAEQGFEVAGFSHKAGEIKKKWTDKYPYGNGFFVFWRPPNA